MALARLSCIIHDGTIRPEHINNVRIRYAEGDGEIEGYMMQTKTIAEKLKRDLLKARAKKVASIKNKIDSGKYNINNLALAKALFLSQ